MKRIITVFTFVVIIPLFTGCSITLNGASTVGLKTVNVGFFENNAQLVVNSLSQTFTEGLKTRIRSNYRLSFLQGEGNCRFSGSITGYSIAPIAIQATNNNAPPIASGSVLSITVSVKYVNDVDPKLSFNETFTKTQNFSGEIASQEQKLILDITNQLTEDIFNKAFANW